MRVRWFVFTGLIEGLGEVKSINRRGGLFRLKVDLGHLASGVSPGESINIDGACLTALQRRENLVLFEIVEETARRTTLAGLKPGDKVNLERALKLSDRLGGHIVLGHIDGVGRVLSKKPQAAQTLMTISVPEELSRYIIPKGSVAVDGVSLTVVTAGTRRFSVALIPYTLTNTTLGTKGVGDKVNIEVDVLGKWIEKLLGSRVQGSINIKRLEELGFA